MRSRTTWSTREYCSIGLVLIGHTLLVLLFVQVRHRDRPAEAASRTTLFFIEPSSRVSEPSPQLVVPRATTLVIPPPTLPSEVVDVTPATTPSIAGRSSDWRGEAQRSASRAIEAHTAPKPRGFEERAPASREAKQRKFNWDPSPGRFGISGGLPYMELGKRCVIGLGFFGCGIGKLPQPDGTLFEDMDDPNRSRDSVPE